MKRLTNGYPDIEGKSLTTILDYGTKEYRDFRSFLSEFFPKPKQKFDSPLIVPLTSVVPSLIGTAFDYLLRFHLEKRYRTKVVCTPWVSEHAINGYFRNRGIAFQSFGLDDELDARAVERLVSIKKNVPKKFHWCKDVQSRFLRAKRNDSLQLLEACLFLAKLDNIYRRGLPTVEELKTLFDIRKEDVVELQSLIGCCSLDQFKPHKHIILNPGFGTDIVSADADLVVDEMLIDVKVTKHLKLTRAYFNQLIGYFLLYVIGGIRVKRKVRISKLGIYFARHGFLWSIDVESIGNDSIFRRAADILKQSPKQGGT